MSNHFKSIGLFCWAAWCEFSRLRRPVLQFFSGIFNFFLLFSECFQFPRSQFPIGCDFFVFCSCWQNGNCTHFHSFPHYANVSPCVPAGKTVQWTIFRAQVPPRPDWPEKGTVPSPSGLAHASRKCLHSPRGDRSLIVHHTEKSERILFVDAFGFVFL